VSDRPVLYVIGTAAPPVRELAEPCRLVMAAGWQPYVTLTPTAADWVDVAGLARVTGHPVRVEPRRPGEADPLPPATAVLAAPLTFNTINKWASGISDTVALGLLNELLSAGPTIVAAPCVKPVLRAHPAYEPSVRMLRSAGVQFVTDAGEARGPDGLATFDWNRVVQHLSRATRAA
jgi:phosphopantothenoylcysteine decarboxylase